MRIQKIEYERGQRKQAYVIFSIFTKDAFSDIQEVVEFAADSWRGLLWQFACAAYRTWRIERRDIPLRKEKGWK